MNIYNFSRYEVDPVVDDNPYNRIMAELKRRDRKNGNMLHMLLFDRPIAQDAIERLCCYISDGIKQEQEPVIYPIIEAALRRYERTVVHDNDEKFEDPARLSAFLDAMLTEICAALEISIVDEKGRDWRVGDDESFAQWRAEHPGELRIVPEPHDDVPELRDILYERIVSDRIQRVLQRANYEEAVVAGCVAAGR